MILQHLKNPFSNSRVSDEKFDKFCQTHLARLESNNDAGTFTGFINVLRPVYISFANSITDESAEDALKEGKTISVEDAMRLMKSFVQRKQGAVQEKFGKGSAAYEEFFPHGMTEYSIAGMKKLEIIFTRFVNKCRSFKTQLGTQIGDEGQFLLDTFTTSRTLQLREIGEVKQMSNDSVEKRQILADAMFLVFLDLVKLFVAHQERVLDFYDPSIVRRAHNKEEPRAPAAVAA